MDNFTDVLLLVQLLVIVILSIFVHRSYPTGKIEDLFKQAEKLATATSTEIDDVTLTVARYLHNLILSVQVEDMIEEDAEDEPASVE